MVTNKQKKANEPKKEDLGFFGKWKLKRDLKKLNNFVQAQKKVVEEIKKTGKQLNEKEMEVLNGLKAQMIDSILGNKDKGIDGMATAFEITDENTGKEMTREEMEKIEVEEITELFENLIDSLQKEI